MMEVGGLFFDFEAVRTDLTEMLRAGEGSDGEGDEEAEAGRVVVDHGLPVLSTTTISESRAHATEVPLLLVSPLCFYRRVSGSR